MASEKKSCMGCKYNEHPDLEYLKWCCSHPEKEMFPGGGPGCWCHLWESLDTQLEIRDD